MTRMLMAVLIGFTFFGFQSFAGGDCCAKECALTENSAIQNSQGVDARVEKTHNHAVQRSDRLGEMANRKISNINSGN